MLLKTQQQWMQALLNPAAMNNEMTNDFRGGMRSADAAFAVYVNNVRANVLNALVQSFPATQALAGEAVMRRATLKLLQHSPPNSGDLGVYGGELVTAIAGCVESQRERITELARYEWLLDQLRRVQGEATWSMESAASLAPDQWPSLRLRLAKQAALFESKLAVRAGDHDSERLLLVATDDDVSIIDLSTAEMIWLHALNNVLNNADLESATQQALLVNEDFDLQSLLAKLLKMNALAVPEG